MKYSTHLNNTQYSSTILWLGQLKTNFMLIKCFVVVNVVTDNFSITKMEGGDSLQAGHKQM